MKGLKCWKKLKEGEEQKAFSKGIYGIDGNHIYQNTKDSNKIVSLSKIQGGSGTVTQYHGLGLEKKSWAFHSRKDAVNEIKKFMKEHDTC